MDFRLFNCDRTYDLDNVKALIVKVSPKANVKQHYFPLPRMSELCNELNEEGTFTGYAVFVVHAHESRLSLNEVNAGIGYAKLYQTLLKITDGRVLIVIGGDNNYKGQEQDDSFLSQWAWRKICSQFTEDFMDGTNSFIFSWDEEHRPIHEEALAFYLDPNRKTLGKFVPKPKPKAPEVRRTVGQKDTKTDRPKSFNQHEPLSAQGKKSDQLYPKKDSAVVRHSNAGQKDTTTDRPKSFNQHEPLSAQGKTSDQLYPKDGGAPKREMFPPENNAGRVLPAQPKQLENLKYDFQKPASSKSMDVDEVDSPIQKRAFPAVHVVSMVPQSEEIRDDFLNNPAMNLLGDVFQNLNIPWGPHFPDIKPKDLPKHVKATSPDLVVLVSEYEDIIDVKSLNNQLKQFRDLLQSVKNEESSKLVIVVTGDKFYKQGDMSSTTVEKEVKDINKGILKEDKLKILSWNSYPSYTHQDVIANLLRMFKPKELQQKVSNRSLVTPEYDVKRGTLRCRSIIQDERVLAILKSDPSDWSPSESLLSDVMAKCRGRCKVELWEDSSGDINVSMSSAAFLCKVLEIPSTERRHSLQVYGYHSNTRIFDVVKTFIKGLDLGADVHPRNTKIDLPALLQNIAGKQPEFVVFSSDMDFCRDITSIQEHVRKYSSEVSALVNLKGIIIMLVGDENCRDGDPVSDVVKQSVMQLKSEIQIDPNKITVLSWREDPYIAHQDIVKDLLIKAKQQSLPKATEFDTTKGYLRYRALLEYGRVVKEIVRLPPNWNPDESDLKFIADKYRDVEKAVLEFWADSYDRPPKGPVVKEPEKSCLSKFTSWFRKNDGDYV